MGKLFLPSPFNAQYRIYKTNAIERFSMLRGTQAK